MRQHSSPPFPALQHYSKFSLLTSFFNRVYCPAPNGRLVTQ
ncbi:hypothetical protein [Rubritalea tangerina]